MTNLFRDNLSEDVVLKENALAKNSAFAERLMRDLFGAFDAYVTTKRKDQNRIEFVVYSQDQRDRYGWGSTFAVTDKGVEFIDDRGNKVDLVMTLLGMPKDKIINDKNEPYWFGGTYESIKTANPKFWDKACKLAKKRGVELGLGDCYGNNGMRVKLILNPDDSKLNDKLKIVIGCLMAHGITTKLKAA